MIAGKHHLGNLSDGDIVRRYLSGEQLRQISREDGRSHGVIRWILKRNRIRLRNAIDEKRRGSSIGGRKGGATLIGVRKAHALCDGTNVYHKAGQKGGGTLIGVKRAHALLDGTGFYRELGRMVQDLHPETRNHINYSVGPSGISGSLSETIFVCLLDELGARYIHRPSPVETSLGRWFPDVHLLEPLVALGLPAGLIEFKVVRTQQNELSARKAILAGGYLVVGRDLWSEPRKAREHDRQL